MIIQPDYRKEGEVGGRREWKEGRKEVNLLEGEKGDEYIANQKNE